MDAKLHRGKAALSERFDPSLHDPSRRTSPAGVEQCRRAGRVGDEDRDAISRAHGERQAPIRRDVPVRGIDAEPALPIAAVHDHVGPVNLRSAGESCTAGGELVADCWEAVVATSRRIRGR